MTDETTATNETAPEEPMNDTEPEPEAEPAAPAATTGRWKRRAPAILGFVLLIALVAPFVVFAVPQTVGADHGFVVLSGSMEPAISPGDVVIVASGPVAVGDVITYRTGNDVPTTHRVIEEVDGAYRTKGDANENADAGLVDPSQVLGSVVVVIPLIGYVILWANTTVGFALLVVIPLALLVAMEAYRFLETPEETPDASVESSTAESEAPASAVPPQRTVDIAPMDLSLTFWVLLAFSAYAGYVVVSEVSRTGVPSPLGVGVFSGALVGFLLVAGLAGRERLRARRGRRADTESSTVADPETDGTPGGD